MATTDLSRWNTDFRKHYKSVRAQQGRVMTDDDFNENERIHGEDERRSRVDIIGPAGTPDSGFSIANPRVTGGKIDFDITAGTFYLGGLHLELEQNETFQAQSDWLQFSGAALPGPPTTGQRFDLVYLESWLQPVSAVEDNELFEVALGGPDTTTRMKVMRRVRVATGTSAGDCRDDWRALVATWATNQLGTLNNQNELVPNTKLKVEFEPGGNPSDLCSPPVGGGYLGAENQAIRVALTDATHFTWGFDNAAPLYRVRVSTNSAGQRVVIAMLTEPKDQAHWPLSGQVVELLPWSAVLPNAEKLAEIGGLLAKVDGSYDPDNKTFTLTAAVPTGFGEGWKTRPDAAQLGLNEFFYLRVWNRGQDTTSPPAIPFATGTAVSLGQTGLKITITGADRRANDHWIIAARPESPNRVVPWLLEAGRSPHGFRGFYAPLAVIEWRPTLTGTTGSVIRDCRETFPPLTRLRTCCTFTVGDRRSSFGTFSRIQDAIDHLPAAGGEVCVLPGVYEENIRIVNRKNITVHGCGRRTILRDDRRTGGAIIHIEDSQLIAIENLAIDAPAVVGIFLVSSSDEARGLSQIELCDLEFNVRDESAIDCRGGRFIRIERNEMRLSELQRPLSAGSNAGKSAAVFVRADDVRIESNLIETFIQSRSRSPLGGIQIGGGSDRVLIRGNRIHGGNGNGITLGSFTYIRSANRRLLFTEYSRAFDRSVRAYPGASLFVGDDDCPHPDPDPKDPTDPEGNPLVPVSDGDLTDIRIVDNDILMMSLNGIATQRLSVRTSGWPIMVRMLEIDSNRIISCVQVPLGQSPFSTNFPYGYGGISLIACEYLIVRHNRIERCGLSFVDPICGVFVYRGAGLLFEQNEILDNGPPSRAQSLATPGLRGGIVIERTQTPMRSFGAPATVVAPAAVASPREGFPALRVSDNVVISPMGPAIQAIARGLVDIQDNQLTSQGVEITSEALPGSHLSQLAALGGVTIRIFNLGISAEIVDSFTGAQNMRNAQPSLAASSTTTNLSVAAGVVGGKVLFNDNQVLLSAPRFDDRMIFSSVLILSLDDVSKHGNQCECRVGERRLLTNALVFGWSARVADNRYQERLISDRDRISGLSAYTIAFMNSTTDNQGTRCFFVLGLAPDLRVNAPNRSMVELSFKGGCLKAGASRGSAPPGTPFNE